jgi:hypothetical protein
MNIEPTHSGWREGGICLEDRTGATLPSDLGNVACTNFEHLPVSVWTVGMCDCGHKGGNEFRLRVVRSHTV